VCEYRRCRLDKGPHSVPGPADERIRAQICQNGGRRLSSRGSAQPEGGARRGAEGRDAHASAPVPLGRHPSCSGEWILSRRHAASHPRLDLHFMDFPPLPRQMNSAQLPSPGVQNLFSALWKSEREWIWRKCRTAFGPKARKSFLLGN
jgi:hypothetical protein